MNFISECNPYIRMFSHKYKKLADRLPAISTFGELYLTPLFLLLIIQIRSIVTLTTVDYFV